MGWASNYIENLKEGKNVVIYPRGHSMTPKIKSGQRVEITALADETKLVKGDIVLCRVRGNEYLHLISAIKGNSFQISNNKGFVNGWISRNNIFGIATKIG